MHQWCEFGGESIFLALFPGGTLKNATHTPTREYLHVIESGNLITKGGREEIGEKIE